MRRSGTNSFRQIGRREFVRLCAGSMAATAFGCGRRDDYARSKDSTITVLYGPDEWLLGPSGDDPPKFLVFLPLVTRSANGDFEGRLAQSWEHSPDYKRWTVRLRKDVCWHDGVPVTAHDIKFTLDLFMHPDVLWIAAGAYAVTVLDDWTYGITYHVRAINSARLCGCPEDDDYTVCWPKHLLEKLDPKELNSWSFWTHPIGNGPYRYVRHIPETMMELEANPNYYRGKPRIERVVLKFGDPSTPEATTELLSGNVDAVPKINRVDLLNLNCDSRFRIYDAPMGGDFSSGADAVVCILWNERYPQFQDPKVRRALTLAIDRREVHQVLNLPENIPVFDLIFSDRQFRRGELPEALPYDPELAKRLLDEAGWREENREGLRQRDGEPFRFTALVTSVLGEDKAAVYVQAQLRRVGLQMELSPLEWSASRKRIMAGEFEAAIPPIWLLEEDSRRLFGEAASSDASASLGHRASIGFRNPRITTLLDAAANTFNPAERDRIYRRLWPVWEAELPATFLYPEVDTTVARTRVRGLSSPWRADPVWHMDELWLAKES